MNQYNHTVICHCSQSFVITFLGSFFLTSHESFLVSKTPGTPAPLSGSSTKGSPYLQQSFVYLAGQHSLLLSVRGMGLLALDVLPVFGVLRSSGLLQQCLRLSASLSQSLQWSQQSQDTAVLQQSFGLLQQIWFLLNLQQGREILVQVSAVGTCNIHCTLWKVQGEHFLWYTWLNTGRQICPSCYFTSFPIKYKSSHTIMYSKGHANVIVVLHTFSMALTMLNFQIFHAENKHFHLVDVCMLR